MAKCFPLIKLMNRSLLNPFSQTNLNLYRQISINCNCKYSYEGPGKTTATFLDDEVGQYLMVNSINDKGFNLTNGAFAMGPIILFPSFVFRWKVKTIDDITPESLLWFRMIEPRIELIILGIGQMNYWPRESMVKLQKNLQIIRQDLKIEMMATKEAVATYNFMLADYRLVGGAFLPLPSELEQKLLNPQ